MDWLDLQGFIALLIMPRTGFASARGLRVPEFGVWLGADHQPFAGAIFLCARRRIAGGRCSGRAGGRNGSWATRLALSGPGVGG